MKKLILAIVLFLTPAAVWADPSLTLPTALKTIARYKRQHLPIQYYDSMADGSPFDREIQDMAYCYEGMMLASREDFMKNHKIMIARHYAKVSGNTVKIRDEIIAPVFSARNDAHVLRNVVTTYTRPLLKGRQYLGIDGRLHKVSK
ncbi:MAG: hypothetical protein K2W95_00935 [Candidatus Obscuribacterales bacterium]|nr:hypothetical protein [Candidatus Obscuribacterales bacterium]